MTTTTNPGRRRGDGVVVIAIEAAVLKTHTAR
jgi:hypothetical protein